MSKSNRNGPRFDVQYPFYFCFPLTESELPVQYGCIRSNREIVTIDFYGHKDVRLSIQHTQEPQTRRIFDILGRVFEDIEKNPRTTNNRETLFNNALKLSLSFITE